MFSDGLEELDELLDDELDELDELLDDELDELEEPEELPRDGLGAEDDPAELLPDPEDLLPEDPDSGDSEPDDSQLSPPGTGGPGGVGPVESEPGPGVGPGPGPGGSGGIGGIGGPGGPGGPGLVQSRRYLTLYTPFPLVGSQTWNFFVIPVAHSAVTSTQWHPLSLEELLELEWLELEWLELLELECSVLLELE